MARGGAGGLRDLAHAHHRVFVPKAARHLERHGGLLSLSLRSGRRLPSEVLCAGSNTHEGQRQRYRLIWPSVRVIPDPSSKVNGFLRRRQLWRPASAVDKLWMHVYLLNLNFNAIATEMPVLDTAGSSFNGRRGSSRVHLPIHDLVLAHPRNARPLAAR